MSYKKITNKLENLLAEIDHGNRIIQKKLNTALPKEKKFDQKLYVICIYYSILDMSETVLILLKNNQSISIPTIIRSICEALVDLFCMIKNPDFFKQKRKYELAEERKKIKNIDNEMRKKLKNELAFFEKNIERDEHLLSDVISNKKTKKDAFTIAGLLDFYNNIYGPLCDESHNNLHILRNRHTRLVNGKIRCSRSYATEPVDILFFIKLMVHFLEMTVVKAHLFLDIKKMNNHNLKKITQACLECKKTIDVTLSKHNLA